MIARYTTAAVPAAAKGYINTVFKYDYGVDHDDRFLTLVMLQNNMAVNVEVGPCEWWIVTSESECVGFMMVNIPPDGGIVLKAIDRMDLSTTECHLNTRLTIMYVDAKHRKRGIGSRLLRLLVKKCAMENEGVYIDCLPSQMGFFTRRAFTWQNKIGRYNRLIWTSKFHKLRTMSNEKMPSNETFESLYGVLQSEDLRLAFLGCAQSMLREIQDQTSTEEDARVQQHRQLYEAREEAEAASLRNDATQRAEMLSSMRIKRIEKNNLKVAAREAELANRKNHTVDNASDKARSAPSDKEFAKKTICIEQARQHGHDLREREKQRISELQRMMDFAEIGDAIRDGK